MESDLSETSTHPTFERQEPVQLKLKKVLSLLKKGKENLYLLRS